MKKFIAFATIISAIIMGGLMAWAYQYMSGTYSFGVPTYTGCEKTRIDLNIPEGIYKTTDESVAYIDSHGDIILGQKGTARVKAGVWPFFFSADVVVREHSFTELTCTENSVCEYCGFLYEKAPGHEVVEATCEEGSYCATCGEIFAEPLGHNFLDATCTEDSVCEHCGAAGSEKAHGHEWQEATCTAPRTCALCGETEGEALGHVYTIVCCEDTYCDVCGEFLAAAMPHEYCEATCTHGSYCIYCGDVKSGPIAHAYVATEEDNGTRYTCSACGNSYFVEKKKTVQQTTTYDASGVTVSQAAWDVLTLVNNERAAVGLPALTMNNNLVKIAEVRAKEAATSFSHTRPNGTKWYTLFPTYGYNYSSAGENIAGGYDTAAEVVKAWMDSPSHKDNILCSSFTEIGVATYMASDGLYWAQNFGSPK